MGASSNSDRYRSSLAASASAAATCSVTSRYAPTVNARAPSSAHTRRNVTSAYRRAPSAHVTLIRFVTTSRRPSDASARTASLLPWSPGAESRNAVPTTWSGSHPKTVLSDGDAQSTVPSGAYRMRTSAVFPRTWRSSSSESASAVRLARSSSSACRCEVTSMNVVTTAYGRDSPGRTSGWALTEIHASVPSGLRTPIVTSEHRCPVASATFAGSMSRGNGDPSSWIVSQPASIGARPIIWSSVSPRIRSALALHAATVPSASCRTMPSDSASTTERYRSSPASSGSCAPADARTVIATPSSLAPCPLHPRRPHVLGPAAVPQPCRATLRQVTPEP